MILTLTCLLGCNIIEHVLKIKPKCNLSEMRRTRKGEDEGVEGKQKREDVHQVLKCFAYIHTFIVVAAYLFVIYIKMFRPNS